MTKQGRIKYEISNFVHSGYTDYGLIKDGYIEVKPKIVQRMMENQYSEIQEACKAEINKIDGMITNAFLMPTAKLKADDNW